MAVTVPFAPSGQGTLWVPLEHGNRTLVIVTKASSCENPTDHSRKPGESRRLDLLPPGSHVKQSFRKARTVILACRTRPSSRKLLRPASPDSRLVPVVARSLAEPTVLKSSDFGKRRFAALAPRKSFTNTTPSAPPVPIQDRGGDQGDGDSLVVEELLRVAAARA